MAPIIYLNNYPTLNQFLNIELNSMMWILKTLSSKLEDKNRKE